MSSLGEHSETWLTLEGAARRFGVHPTTLRGWADRGLVSCIRTPGGHRRFAESEILRLTAQGDSAASRAMANPTLFDVGLAYTRQRLSRPHGLDVSPVSRESGESAEVRRTEGRELLGLVMRFITAREEDCTLLAAAQAMGQAYAVRNRQTGVSLRDAVAISQFFRDTLIESILESATAARAINIDTSTAVSRVSKLLNQFQLAMIDATVEAPEQPKLPGAELPRP